MSGIVQQIPITHPVGLHARPAVRFTKLAKSFATVEIRVRSGVDGVWVDAKSIVKVIALKARSGTVLELMAEGDGAEAAVAALADLIARDFDEHG